MSTVIKLDSNEWVIDHDFSDFPPLNERIQFAGSTTVFNVYEEVDTRYGLDFDGVSLSLAVIAEQNAFNGPSEYCVEYQIDHEDGSIKTGKFTEKEPTSSLLEFDSENPSILFTLTFKPPVEQSFFKRNAVVESFIGRGPKVTLIGLDGTVAVPRRLLELWSTAFEAMFSHDSKEKRTGIIEMKDFDSQTLAAFVQFLETGEIKDGKETALGLILLSDKYDIQQMKEAAEDFVKKNIGEMNKEGVLEVFYKVGRKSLFDAMDSWIPSKRKRCD